MEKTGFRRGAAFLAALVLLCGAVWLLAGTSQAGSDNSGQPDAAVAEGIAYLRALEAQDPAEVEERLKAQRQAECEAMLATQREQWLEQITSGEVSVWSLFGDAVILGDSRAVGFSFYDFLPSERVMAEGGATIRSVADHLDEIKALNPSIVFLCYGLNDISIGFWTDYASYTAEMDEVIQSILEVVPDATVCVSSALVARDPAFQRSSAWRRIPELNDAVAAMCQEKGYLFADNAQLCADYAKYWETDGIHVQPGLYGHWALNLMTEVYDDALGRMEDSAA